MQDLDLLKIKNVHFIGIGGIGISAVARMMKMMGKNVTGQDMQEGEIVNELKKLGIDIKIGQSFDFIPLDTDLIVYTIAIEYYDPELFKRLKEGDIPVKSYPEMLGLISKDKYTVAISGTHGKTTTTGMISQILVDAGSDPTVIVGSLLSSRTNFIHGESNLFVVEACEYRRSFLNINPKILVITNIDEDHLDYYKDIEDIKRAFKELAMKVPDDGYIICNPNDKNIADVIKDINSNIIDYSKFYDQSLKLKIPGIHNKKDAACAIAVAEILDVNIDESKKSLSQFPGTWRRFEFKGKLLSGALVYDDYAHHPVEISSTLEGFRELYPKVGGWNITIIFQPHLFSRTKLLLNDFAKCFRDANNVLILPIYFAREKDDGSISSRILSDEINKKTNNSISFKDFDEAEKYLYNIKFNEKDIIVTMGAGEAFKVGDKLLKK